LKRAQNEFDAKVKIIRSDNCPEFKNTQVEDCLDQEGIKHEFLTPYTAQQNEVAERNNRTLIESTRTMLVEYKTSDHFWAEAINTVCHAVNQLYLHRLLKKTPYELLTGNKPNVPYFWVFGSKCYVLLKRHKSFKFMKISYLVMIQTLVPIVFSTRTLVMLKPRVMWCLMKLTVLKWSDMILMISYFRVFGSKCYVLLKRPKSPQFSPKAYAGFMLGYDSSSRAYRVFNKDFGCVKTMCDVVFDETNSS
jgi:hypothetical protein